MINLPHSSHLSEQLKNTGTVDFYNCTYGYRKMYFFLILFMKRDNICRQRVPCMCLHTWRNKADSDDMY